MYILRISCGDYNQQLPQKQIFTAINADNKLSNRRKNLSVTLDSKFRIVFRYTIRKIKRYTMPKNNEPEPLHPGPYIKNRIPTGLSVKAAAELLGVGRPALSNLLNGNADLSPEMAVRLEKTFGMSQQELLQMQAQFDQHQERSRDQNIAVRAYVPSFLKITARDIEQWVDGNLEARSRLPVFLRKLVNSTGQELSHVDFPGYDNAEKKGWDGRVDAGAATPWIPLGKSGWEFGCNENPRQKAEGDYSAHV